MKRFAITEKSIPLALFVTNVFAYGLLIPWLGFYWDDWPYLWFAKTLGPEGFADVFSHDRPFLAFLYSVNLPLLGSSPFVWQIFALVWRWLASLAFWWMLKMIWPHKPAQVFWASLLFVVYPGFGQQWISVIYSGAFIILASFVCSLGLMLAAIRKVIPVWPAIIFGFLLSGFNLFSTEYFFGLELIRPILIWLVISETNSSFWQKVKRTVIWWVPYLIVVVAFIIWRTFYFVSANYSISAMESLTNTPQSTLWDMVITFGSNVLNGGWLAWIQTFSPPNALLFNSTTTQLFWLVVVATFIFSLGYLWFLKTESTKDPEEATHPEKWGISAILLGMCSLIMGGIPFWIANLPLTLVFPWNRFTLALMFGSVLLITGLIEVFIRTSRQKVIIIALLISLASGWQFYTANTFRREWEQARDFFWQLSWRVPGLKANTLLLTHEFPFKYYSDNSLTAPINWMYAPEFEGRDMPYMLNYLSVRLRNSLPSAKPNLTVEQSYRALKFTGITSDSLALYLPNTQCLKVMDSVYTNAEMIPDLPFKMEPAIPISNLSLIDLSPESPALPPPQFHPEPEHTWCYYYQKADLARQMGDWQLAARYGEEALAKGYIPDTATEWPVLIEAFGQVKNWKKAIDLTEQAYATIPELRPGLCGIWDRIAENSLTEIEMKNITYIKAVIKCGEPVDSGN